jgi:S-formylglutathione hydrolase FrmB
MAVFNFTFYSKSLGRTAEVTAIVPVEPPMFPIPGMPPFDPDKPLRTIYLLHGFSGSHVDWLRGSRIEQLAMMHRIAVICPSGENSFYIDDKARGALYEQFICRELVEFTRRAFPLSKERADTAIGGLSMGGYGAIRNGFKNSDVFGSIAAFSSALITDGIAEMPDGPAGGPGPEANASPFMIPPSYFAHTFGKRDQIKGSDVDPKALAKKLIDSGAARPNLYMACGSEDFLIEPNRDLHRYLLEIGYEHLYTEGAGTHSWEYWDMHIEKALIWLDELSKARG